MRLAGSYGDLITIAAARDFHIQARVGHESITTTIDTYGHLLSAGDELMSSIIDTALSGETIRPLSNISQE